MSSVKINGLFATHGSVEVFDGSWNHVASSKASNRYRQVSSLELKEGQLIFFDSYYVSSFSKTPMNGVYQNQKGELVLISGQKPSTGSKYLHEIYEELDNPQEYKG